MTQVNQPIHNTKNDMPQDGWIDRFMPEAVRPYLKLLRLDRPIGTWLLLLPCWWSTAMAGGLSADIGAKQIVIMMALFGLGAIIMRGAGCVINDLADRNFDGKVERTTTRPLPSGQVKVWQALLFLGFMMLLGLAILLQFRIEAIIGRHLFDPDHHHLSVHETRDLLATSLPWPCL